jgi:GAF domain-containing protein
VFFEAILDRVRDVVEGDSPRDEKLLAVARTLAQSVPYYNWVGFYFPAAQGAEELHLGPFVGEPTEHAKIPFGKGVCGQVAETKQTMIVPDVKRLTNYLACSVKVQSEIVVPILKGGRFVGELDIDSHARAPFAEADRGLLEKVAALVAEML